MKLAAEHRSPELFEVDGVRVLHFQNQSFLTSIQILTDVGSAAEEKPALSGGNGAGKSNGNDASAENRAGLDERGLAHILEHMFFKGSRKRPGGPSISRAANDIGGKMNAYTAYDHTAYFITVLNDSFEEGFDILADMYRHPLFPPEEFAKELNPILSEYREREDDPENYLVERSLEEFFGAGYHPIIGTQESIKGATVDMMHAFHKRFYGAEHMLVCVVGGVDQERVSQAVRNHFAGMHAASPAPQRIAEHRPGELHLTRPGIHEAYYSLFFPALPPGHPDRYKQDMMNYLLGGNDSALLFERIREELGMSCYGIYSFTMRHEPYAALGVGCGIAPEELERLHQEVTDQIKLIQDAPLSSDRIERARASLRTSIAARSETSGGMAGMIGVPVLRGERENPVEKALREIEAISAEDILEQARSTFSGPMFYSTLTPEA